MLTSGSTTRTRPALLRSNSVLLLFDSLYRMGTGFLVSVLLAREYGSHGLGVVTTAIATTTIVLGFSALGLSGVLVRELVNRPDRRGTIIQSVVVAKAATGLLLFVAMLVVLLATGRDAELIRLTTIMSVGYLFIALDPVDALYNARAEFTRLVTLRAVAISLSLIVKVGATLLHLPLELVAVGYAIDYAFLYLLPALDFARRRENGLREIREDMRFDAVEVRGLLRSSWPILVSGGFAQLNLKLDVLLIASLASVSQVGIYSAAARLSEAWSVLAMAVVTAAFPALIAASTRDPAEYAQRLSSVLRRLIWIAVLGAAVIAVLSGPIVRLIYGGQFGDSAQVLSVHVFAGIFLFVRTAVSRWLIVEDLLAFSLVSHVGGVVVNVALNIVLIPTMGVVGAAWASLASYAASGVLFLALTSRTRPMLSMILWSSLPSRYGWTGARSAVDRMIARRRV